MTINLNLTNNGNNENNENNENDLLDVDKMLIDLFLPYITYLRILMNDNENIKKEIKNYIEDNKRNNSNEVNKINKKILIEILKKNLELINS